MEIEIRLNYGWNSGMYCRNWSSVETSILFLLPNQPKAFCCERISESSVFLSLT